MFISKSVTYFEGGGDAERYCGYGWLIEVHGFFELQIMNYCVLLCMCLWTEAP